MTLHDVICEAMLDYLHSLPEDKQDWDAWPVKVTGWEEHGYQPSACETCGDDWPEITINYEDEEGYEGNYFMIEDFGKFITKLCDRKTNLNPTLADTLNDLTQTMKNTALAAGIVQEETIG